MKKFLYCKNENVISYAEYGNRSGYPILINHGLIASIKDWDLFERLIQLGAHLVCIARPGYGESSPYEMRNLAEWGDIVSVLIDELHLSQFDVLGMSSGAPYSYALGYKFPDRARDIYIFNGIPALYDKEVLSCWPYPVDRDASIPELKSLAHELFFSNLSEEDLEKDDIKDSLSNDCFGIAQDFKIRCMDWGYCLADVKQNIFMRHSRFDEGVPFITASLTSKLLPNCHLEGIESAEHFSKEALDAFIKDVIAPNYKSETLPRPSQTVGRHEE